MDILKAKQIFEKREPFNARKNNEKQIKILDKMKVHIDGCYPYSLIEKRRPYEDELILQYRKDNYEPLTMSLFRKAIDSSHKVFNQDNYSLSMSNDLTEYFSKKKYNNLLVMDYLQSYVFINIFRDPNGFHFVYPIFNENDSNAKPEIGLIYVSSDLIIENNIEYIAFWSDETKISYWIADNESIYVFNKTEKGDFIGSLFAMHSLERIPAIINGGIWIESNKCFDSFFSAAVGFANEFIKHYNDWQGLMVTCGHPIRSMKQTQCNDCMGKGYHGNKEDKTTCNTCHGTCVTFATSPYGVYYEKNANPALDGSEIKDTAPITYHSPPIEPLTNYQQAYEMMWKKTEESLNLEPVMEAQSGVAKAIDKENADSMDLEISNNFWRIVESFLLICEGYRNKQTFENPNIIKPTSFSTRSESDLIEEITKLENAKVPQDLKSEIYKEFYRKRFFGNTSLILMYEFLIDTDPLFTRNDEEKIFLKQSGYNLDDILYSFYAKDYLRPLIEENKFQLSKLFANKQSLRLRLMQSIKKDKVMQEPTL